MLQPAPLPFALATTTFRFPALAALAGRLPLGAGRESALAMLLVARLAASVVSGPALPRDIRSVRASATVHWLAATCPDARVRAACTRVAEATAGIDGAAVAQALGRVIELLPSQTPADARSELLTLIERLSKHQDGRA